MSRKFVEREGRMWIDKGIVTDNQYQQILNLYEEKKRAIGLLPLFGSILVGLGILLFIASNWQGIPDMIRVAMILVLMTGLYVLGELFSRKQSPRLGIAFTGLGLISFGAGIILIGQMFNMEAYDMTSWIVWGAVGVVLTYLYQSRYLYLISILILTIAQWNSIQSFNQLSYVGAFILIVGLGAYLLLNRNQLLAWALSVSIVILALQWMQELDLRFFWVFIPILALYVIGDIVKDFRLTIPFQYGALASLFIYQVVFVLSYNNGMNRDFFAPLQEQYGFLISLLVLLAISVYFKVRGKRASSAVEWIIAPFLLFIPQYADFIGMLLLFIFSLFVLWTGYREQWSFQINLGTFLFLASTLTAYSKLTWNFMDRSMFFIIGGVLLLVVSWFLNRRKNQFLQETKEA